MPVQSADHTGSGSEGSFTVIIYIYVSESDILGPNGNLSYIQNLVSFKSDMFEDYSYKY